VGRTLVANKLLAGSACGKRHRGRPLNLVARHHMDSDENASAVWFGVVVAIGALFMGWLSIDGLVSGETVHIGKNRTGMLLTGAKGVGVAIAYGAFAVSMALFAIACFNANTERRDSLISWTKRIFIAAGLLLLVAALFLKCTGTCDA
jgi:hypothetical protein